MKTLVPWKFRYSNLRNHRKILVVDGKIGFTGGMNIADEYYHAEGEGTPATGQDTHFRLEGPIVSELQYVFAEDWIFSSGEELQGPEWFPEMEPRGTVPARGIADGPDENYDAIRFALLGAIATADQKIDICTPYFLPDDELLSALYVAVMRGIEVNLLVPVRTNSRLVQWASRPGLKKLVEAGCNVYLTRSPFNHSKLMVVDEIWSFIGSANWDARSLKLNFEFNVELYDREFARKLSSKINEWKQDSDQARVRDFTGNLATNLRDRAVRLFSPYL